jgi:hypothetical protein
MKKLLFTSFIFLLFGISSRGSNYYTVSNGAWTAPATWSGGMVPPLAGSDSIFIYHNVMYTSFLHLVSSTYVFIDTGGTLCGHRKFSIQPGSVMDNHGEFNADSLYINGGLLNNYGNILLANTAVVTNGGSMFNAGTMQIGAVFLCTEETNAVMEQENTVSFSISPIPVKAGERIHMNTDAEIGNGEIYLLNISGELIRSQPLKKEEEIEIVGLSPGIYFLRIESGGSGYYHKLVIVDKE